MRHEDIIYTDYEEDTKKMAKICSTCFLGMIEFVVEVQGKTHRCLLYPEENQRWSLSIDDDPDRIGLSFLNDTYWNSRELYYTLGDSETACAIGGALCEIYKKGKDILL